MKPLDITGEKRNVAGQRPRVKQDGGEATDAGETGLPAEPGGPHGPGCSECRWPGLEGSDVCVIFLGKWDCTFLDGRNGIFQIFSFSPGTAYAPRVWCLSINK